MYWPPTLYPLCISVVCSQCAVCVSFTDLKNFHFFVAVPAAMATTATTDSALTSHRLFPPYEGAHTRPNLVQLAIAFSHWHMDLDISLLSCLLFCISIHPGRERAMQKPPRVEHELGSVVVVVVVTFALELWDSVTLRRRRQLLFTHLATQSRSDVVRPA